VKRTLLPASKFTEMALSRAARLQRDRGLHELGVRGLLAARLEPSFDDGLERRPTLPALEKPAPFPVWPSLGERAITPWTTGRRECPRDHHSSSPLNSRCAALYLSWSAFLKVASS
jgi:hypothetical protein